MQRLYNMVKIKREIRHLTEFFKNKYRVPSARLVGWDYASPCAYFVTICCHQHKCWFGSIQNKNMYFSAIGEVAHRFWNEIPEHFDKVILDEFVVMPNHVHGILILTDEGGAWTFMGQNHTHWFSNAADTFPSMSEIAPKPGSLSTIIRSYKSAVTHWAHQNNIFAFRWQGRFHDHIIRNEGEYNRIRYYIKHNVELWEDDRYHSNCREE